MTSPLRILYRGSLLSCNYDCHYCPFAKGKDTRASLKHDADQLNRFVSWVGDQKRLISVLFTPWGEALVRPYYQKAILALGAMPHVQRIAIQTNLSLSNTAIQRCKSEKLALWCTYHPSQISREKFLKKCAFLIEQNIRFSVGMVGNKNELTEISAMREALHNSIYLWVNANRDEQSSYDQQALELLRAIDPLFEDNLHSYPSLGKKCLTGSEVISVDGSGNVTRCHFVKEPLGNLYDGSFTPTTDKCPAKTCDCHIGYIHMPELNLYKKYGDGVLERIAVQTDQPS